MKYNSLKKIAQELYDQSTSEEDRFKYELILNILNDDDCFKKMKTETAYKLLKDLKYEDDEINKIYDSIIFDNNSL